MGVEESLRVFAAEMQIKAAEPPSDDQEETMLRILVIVEAQVALRGVIHRGGKDMEEGCSKYGMAVEIAKTIISQGNGLGIFPNW